MENTSQPAIMRPRFSGTLSPNNAVMMVQTKATPYIGMVRKLIFWVEASPKRPLIRVG